MRISRVQKQIYLHFAEAKYLRRSQRYEKEGAIVRVCTQELPNRFLFSAKIICSGIFRPLPAQVSSNCNVGKVRYSARKPLPVVACLEPSDHRRSESDVFHFVQPFDRDSSGCGYPIPLLFGVRAVGFEQGDRPAQGLQNAFLSLLRVKAQLYPALHRCPDITEGEGDTAGAERRGRTE